MICIPKSSRKENDNSKSFHSQVKQEHNLPTIKVLIHWLNRTNFISEFFAYCSDIMVPINQFTHTSLKKLLTLENSNLPTFSFKLLDFSSSNHTLFSLISYLVLVTLYITTKEAFFTLFLIFLFVAKAYGN